jgi:hypothetical protein
MKKAAAGFIAALALAGAHEAVASISLYDGTQPGLPQTQGWLAYQSIPTTTPTLASTVGPTTLNTSASNAIYAGFSNYASNGISESLVNSAFPTLSPTTGFDLTFNTKLDSESHTGNSNRAGFSVILLGNDLNGVELGFWNGLIFAQSSTFTQTVEETSSFDPAAQFHQYDLHIQGSTYTLTANGTQILTGPTRNYSGSGLLPYETPNFVFLGDDTTSAQAVTEIEAVSVSVPEPASLSALIIIPMLLRRRRRSL